MIAPGLVVLLADHASDNRSGPQQRKEVAGGKHATHLLRAPICDQRNRFRIESGVGRDQRKTMLLRLPVLVVGIGGLDPARNLRVALRQGDDAPRIRKGQRFEQEGVDAAEYGRGGTHSESECHNYGRRKYGRPAQFARGVNEIPEESMHRLTLFRIMTALHRSSLRLKHILGL